MMAQSTIEVWPYGVVLVATGAIVGFLIAHYYYNYSESAEAEPTQTATRLGPISIVEVSVSERELEELLKEVDGWELNRFDRLLANFLLPREIRVFHTLAAALVTSPDSDLESLFDESKGWLNKHQIHLKSEVSRKVVYSRFGVLERFVTLDLMRSREVSSWGRSKHRYRLNTDNDFSLAYAKVLLRS
jgi:hypothetical protein